MRHHFELPSTVDPLLPKLYNPTIRAPRFRIAALFESSVVSASAIAEAFLAQQEIRPRI